MTSEVEKADELSGRRAAMLPFYGFLVVAIPQVFFASENFEDPSLPATILWLVLVALATAALCSHWLWTRSVGMRALVEDEITEANRSVAIRRAFYVAMFMSLLVYVVAPFEPLSAQRAAHLIVSASLACGLLSFGFLELKSHG